MKKLLAVLLLAGCATPPPQSTPLPGTETVRVEPKDLTALSLVHYDTLLGSESGQHSPALRFDLSSVPKDATVRRALLRLRRGYEQKGPRTYPIYVTNVNRGLRSGETVTMEEEIWPGMRGVEEKVQNQTYGAWLRANNPTIDARLASGVEWDEIDVTTFVQAELRGDHSLLLLLASPSMIQMQWFDLRDETEIGPRRNRPEFHPHLRLEITRGAVSEEPIRKVAGRLLLRSTPAPAKIYLDGEFVGTTVSDGPVEFPAAASRVRIRFVKSGHKPWEETVKISETGPTQVHAELDPE